MRTWTRCGTIRGAARGAISGKLARIVGGLVGGFLLLAAMSSARGQPVFYNVVHTFQYTNTPDGSDSSTPLLLASNHSLYGTTLGGGTNGARGVLFAVNPDGSGYRILHEFAGVTGHDPEGGLIQGLDDKLYGTTSEGTSNAGVVFSIRLDGQNYTVLHAFTNSPDGALPYGELVQANDGVLYGVTHGGGLGYGTIYSINPDGSGYHVLHEFNEIPDGGQPEAGLVLTGGMLYGTTTEGGADINSTGTVFRISPSGSGYQVLHDFTGGTDGVGPLGRLVQGTDAALYGTTAGGGTNNNGTVFKLDLDGNNYQILHSFGNSPDGTSPEAGLVRGGSGALYGTTLFGGAGPYGGGGTIFRIFENGSGYQVVYMFTNSVDDGALPFAALIRGPVIPGSPGLFYGTTSTGGRGSAGTVFSLLINPPISITPVRDGPTLFWPAWAINYVLQSTTNMSIGPWVGVTNGIPITGVQLPGATNPPTAFYRLVWLP